MRLGAAKFSYDHPGERVAPAAERWPVGESGAPEEHRGRVLRFRALECARDARPSQYYRIGATGSRCAKRVLNPLGRSFLNPPL